MWQELGRSRVEIGLQYEINRCDVTLLQHGITRKSMRRDIKANAEINRKQGDLLQHGTTQSNSMVEG